VDIDADVDRHMQTTCCYNTVRQENSVTYSVLLACRCRMGATGLESLAKVQFTLYSSLGLEYAMFDFLITVAFMILGSEASKSSGMKQRYPSS
jgi:hypothetical protein